MPTDLQIEKDFWTTQVQSASHTALTNVRATAAKWSAAATALLGTFVTASFIWGPDKLEKFPFKAGAGRDIALGTLGLSGVLGIIAIILLSLAANGVPKVESNMNWASLKKETGNRAKCARKQMLTGMAFAGLAGIGVLCATGAIMTAAAIKAPSPTSVHAVVVEASGTYCGALTTGSDGKLSVTPDEGPPTSVTEDAKVTVVDDCPG